MITQKLFDQIRDHMADVIAQTPPLGISLWHDLLKSHPADIAQFFSNLDYEEVQALFLKFPEQKKLAVFQDLSFQLKVFCLSFLDDHDRGHLLSDLPIDELTDFFDELSDEELKDYLKLLHKKDREQVLSLLQFNPESAGGIMDTNVLTLMQDFTIERSIQILQRLQPSRELHQQIFVTNQDNELVGHIQLEDLVLKHSKTRLSSILHPNELVAQVHEDREDIAKKMVHYSVMTIPVVNMENIFLGVIPSDTLVEIIEQETSEDIYRMAALKPMKHTYFETPFLHLLYQRSSILVVLLLLQVFSTMIIEHYEILLCGFLTYFISMLTSTGGNASSQTSALVIQGMATGEIDELNRFRFIRREFFMAIIMAMLLGFVSFMRIYFTHGDVLKSFAVSVSLAVTVLVSIILGSCMPLLLKRLNIDPAHSAGPVLTTLIDIIGLFIYCFVSQLILF